MSDFIGDRECVTHHYACDCRESSFKELKKDSEKLVEALEYYANDDWYWRTDKGEFPIVTDNGTTAQFALDNWKTKYEKEDK